MQEFALGALSEIAGGSIFTYPKGI